MYKIWENEYVKIFNGGFSTAEIHIGVSVCLSLKEEEKYENIIRMDDLFRFLMVLL